MKKYRRRKNPLRVRHLLSFAVKKWRGREKEGRRNRREKRSWTGKTKLKLKIHPTVHRETIFEPKRWGCVQAFVNSMNTNHTEFPVMVMTTHLSHINNHTPSSHSWPHTFLTLMTTHLSDINDHTPSSHQWPHTFLTHNSGSSWQVCLYRPYDS